MLKILRKITPSMAARDGSVTAEPYAYVDDDLSVWEIVDAAQCDEEEDLYYFDADDLMKVVSDVVDDVPVPESAADRGDDEENKKNAPEVSDFLSKDDVISIQSLAVSLPINLPAEMTGTSKAYRDDYDDEDDDDEAYDVDDELVPWKLKAKFGKQRIRKMGKREQKIKHSHRLPYLYNRPGAVYGKHGFGQQHAYI